MYTFCIPTSKGSPLTPPPPPSTDRLTASGGKGGDTSKLQKRIDELKRELDDTKQKLLEKSDSLLGSVQRGHEVCLRGADWVCRGAMRCVCVVLAGSGWVCCLLLLRSWGMHSQFPLSVLQMTLETKRLTAELGQKKDELAMTNDM